MSLWAQKCNRTLAAKAVGPDVKARKSPEQQRTGSRAPVEVMHPCPTYGCGAVAVSGIFCGEKHDRIGHRRGLLQAFSFLLSALKILAVGLQTT